MRRILASCLIVLYLGGHGWFLLRHLLGDPYATRFAYFWTWDMYPNFQCGTTRVVAIGETRTGRFVQLAPNGRQRFRWGTRNHLNRLDFDQSRQLLQRAAQDGVQRYQTAPADDPLVRVVLLEEFQPARIPAAQAVMQSPLAGRDPPRAWRVLADRPLSSQSTTP